MDKNAISYYSNCLCAERLKKCYEIAPPRIQQYFIAEMDFVRENLRLGDVVLDLGCGYGRTISPLAHKARFVVGVDISCLSLRLAQSSNNLSRSCLFLEMDTANLAFLDGTFDAVYLYPERDLG